MYVRRMAGENYEKFWDNGMEDVYTLLGWVFQKKC